MSEGQYPENRAPAGGFPGPDRRLQAHGTLAGAYCAASITVSGTGCADLRAEGTSHEVPVAWKALFGDTRQALAGGQMQFDVMLPGDEVPIADRAAALGHWCQSFLYGLERNPGPDADSLPDEVAEIVPRPDLDPPRSRSTRRRPTGANMSRPTPSWSSSCVSAHSCCSTSWRASAVPHPGSRCADPGWPGAALRPRSRCRVVTTTTVPPSATASRATRMRRTEAPRRARPAASAPRVRPISRPTNSRAVITQLMKTMGRDSIAILPAAPVRLRNNDVEYAYRQDSDFHYLTGFPEPEAVAVFVPGREQVSTMLFVRERDPARETWDGRRAGRKVRRGTTAPDDAFPINDIGEILPGLMENRARVFYTVGVNREFDLRVVSWVNALRAQAKHGRHPPHEMSALEHVLHDMRLFKSKAEVELMREAARIAARAHVRAMRYAGRDSTNTR